MYRNWIPLFNLMVLGSLLLWSSVAWAKQPLVAVILVRDIPRYQTIHNSFEKYFSQSGQPDAPRIYVQTPNPDLMSLRNSARKAVAIGADLILVYGALPALAAQAESFTTPIIFADVFEPVAQGLIPEAGRASRYATGVFGNGPTPTLVKLFQQSTGARSLLSIYDPDDPTSKLQHELLTEAAVKRGLRATSLAIDCEKPFLAQIQGVSADVGGIYLTDGLKLKSQARKLIDHATTLGVPVISQIPGLAEQGAFMVLEEDLDEQGQLAAELVRRYLDGEKLKDLNPVYPRKVAFIVNLNTAKGFKIQVPFEILAVTNRVIR